MAFELTDVDLTEISLVTKPANQEALVVLVKQDDRELDPVSIDAYVTEQVAKAAEHTTPHDELGRFTGGGAGGGAGSAGAGESRESSAADRAKSKINLTNWKESAKTIVARTVATLRRAGSDDMSRGMAYGLKERFPGTIKTREQAAELAEWAAGRIPVVGATSQDGAVMARLKYTATELVRAFDRVGKSLDAMPASREDGMLHQDERAGLIARLAKYLGVGTKQDGALVVEIDKEADDMAETQTHEPLSEATQAAVDGAIAKALAPVQAQLQSLRGENATLKAENSELRSGITKSTTRKAARARLPKAMHGPFDEMDEDEQDEFLARLDGGKDKDKPNPVAKALTDLSSANESLAAKIAKMEGEQAQRDLVAKFVDLTGTVDVAKFADRYAKLQKLDPDGAELMVTEARANAARIKKGGIFTVLGKDGEAPIRDAETKVEKAATEIRKTAPGLTKEQAIVKALEADPELYTEYDREHMERSHRG